MLKVHKSSWHYKLAYNKFSAFIFKQKEPKDLCTYMRQVLKPMFWSVILWTGIVGSIYDVHMLSLYGEAEWVWPEMSIFSLILLYILCALGWGLMFIITLIVAIGTLVIIAHFFQEVLWESLCKLYKVRREEKLEDKEPEPNLLWEWCKAQKQRVCPLIEVVED